MRDSDVNRMIEGAEQGIRTNMEKIQHEFRLQKAAEKTIVDALLAKGEFLDEDGYPTQDALTIVELWPYNDTEGWFIFINSLWHLKSWGWCEDIIDPQTRLGYGHVSNPIREYNLSTAGWSGNEALIRAMEENDMLWHTTWTQSRRGGHYIFEVELDV